MKTRAILLLLPLALGAVPANGRPETSLPARSTTEFIGSCEAGPLERKTEPLPQWTLDPNDDPRSARTFGVMHVTADTPRPGALVEGLRLRDERSLALVPSLGTLVRCHVDDDGPLDLTNEPLLFLMADTAAMLGPGNSYGGRFEIRLAPDSGVAREVVEEMIRSVDHELRLSLEQLVSTELTDLLVETHRRGVDVRLVVSPHRTPEQQLQTYRLAVAGVEVAITDEERRNDFGVGDAEHVLISPEAWQHGDALREQALLAAIEDPVLGDRLVRRFDDLMMAATTISDLSWESLDADTACLNDDDDDDDDLHDFADPSCYIDTGIQLYAHSHVRIDEYLCDELSIETADADGDGWLEQIRLYCLGPENSLRCFEPEYPTPTPTFVSCSQWLEE